MVGQKARILLGLQYRLLDFSSPTFYTFVSMGIEYCSISHGSKVEGKDLYSGNLPTFNCRATDVF